MNNKYEIKVGPPLVRPGLEIKTEVSEAYLIRVLNEIFSQIREFNRQQEGGNAIHDQS